MPTLFNFPVFGMPGSSANEEPNIPVLQSRKQVHLHKKE